MITMAARYRSHSAVKSAVSKGSEAPQPGSGRRLPGSPRWRDSSGMVYPRVKEGLDLVRSEARDWGPGVEWRAGGGA